MTYKPTQKEKESMKNELLDALALQFEVYPFEKMVQDALVKYTKKQISWAKKKFAFTIEEVGS